MSSQLMSMPSAAEGFSTAMKVIAAILTLVIPSLTAGTAPSAILEQAARGIENHRKGDATIHFVRKDGTPSAGLKVEAIQRTHDFAFGNLFRPRHYTNELYRVRFLEVFNLLLGDFEEFSRLIIILHEQVIIS